MVMLQTITEKCARRMQQYNPCKSQRKKTLDAKQVLYGEISLTTQE